jgi:hypothetical protein
VGVRRFRRLKPAVIDILPRRGSLDIALLQSDTHGKLFIRRINLDTIAAHTKLSAFENNVIAFVLNVHELGEHFVVVDCCVAVLGAMTFAIVNALVTTQSRTGNAFESCIFCPVSMLWINAAIACG